MYKFAKKIVLLITLALLTIMNLDAQEKNEKWDLLAPIPDSLGFAGSYAGTLAGGLIYAGGAQFKQGTPPWQGGVKVWTDQIYFLESLHGTWKPIGNLPRPLGYGASASYDGTFFLAGGSDAANHYQNTYQLSLAGDQIQIKELPSLPVALANTAFAQHENYWYVLGGQIAPLADQASSRVFRLDLSAPQKGWKELPPFPGKGRILAVAAARAGSLYIFSGASLEKRERTYLLDGFCFNGKSWNKAADLDAPITAAANPGIATSENEFVFFSGDDGSLASSDLRDKHPGFSRQVLTYFVSQDKWEVTESTPPFLAEKQDGSSLPIQAPVTTTAVLWKENIIIPGGEVRPAVRTNQVLRYKP